MDEEQYSQQSGQPWEPMQMPEQNFEPVAAEPQSGEEPMPDPAPLQAPRPTSPDGAYRYIPQPEGFRLTPQQFDTGEQSGYTPQPEEKKKRAKKQVSRVWIPVLLVAAILLGLGGGVLGYMIASKNNRASAQSVQGEQTELPTPTQPKSPITDSIRRNESGTGMTPAQIYSEYVGAVVGIASESTGRNVWGQTVKQASSGTGFIITQDGYVVTNAHVVEGANAVTVQLYDGREFPATVVGYEDTTCDVALLKIDATDLPTVSIGDSDATVTGDEVCAIGNPLGELTFTLTVGYISALDREINTDGTPINMFQTDAAINSGNSGGPLFDMDGNVIAITTAKYSGSTTSGTSIEGLGFAIPINDAMQIINDLTQYGYVKNKPFLGVSVGDSGYYGKNLPAGAYVTAVTEGAAAQKAGIAVGDVIVGLGDSVIGSQADLQSALSAFKAGDKVRVTVYRGGQYLKLELTLDERPQDTETEPEVTETESDPYGFGQFGFGWPFP